MCMNECGSQLICAAVAVAGWSTGTVALVSAGAATLFVALGAMLFIRHGRAEVAARLSALADSEELDLSSGAAVANLPGLGDSLARMLGRCRREIDELRTGNRELQIQARVLEADKQRVESIIQCIGDAVIVTDRHGEVTLANSAAADVFGFGPDGAQRKPLADVLHDETLVRAVRDLSVQSGASRRKFSHEIETNGQSRTFHVTVDRVASSTRETTGVVVVLHDVTREKEIGQMKTDFVSNVSHELRTPLAGIKAYVEMLQDGEAEDEQTQREFLGVIAGETERLSRLIDNVLNIARIESGVVKVVRVPMELTAVVKELIDVARPEAAGKDVNVVEKLGPIYGQIEADRDMISQAVMNLISNAIKYTPEGGTVTIETAVDEGRSLTFCRVSDTGVGIPPEDVPHIFDKFYRVRSNNRMAKGTGLGLSLVKEIVETVHHGAVEVHSEVGRGSTFSIALPLCR